MSSLYDLLLLPERVYTTTTAGSTALDASNGTIQVITMGGAHALTDSIAAGESITLQLKSGDTNAPTWPTMTWVGGSAPTLTSDDIIVIWKIASTLYGSYVGSVE